MPKPPEVQEIAEPRYLTWTIGDVLEEKGRLNGDRPFLYYHDTAVTWRDLDKMSNRLGNSLLSMGMAKGDKVAVMLPNGPDFLYTWLGCGKAGAVMVPVNTGQKGEGLQYILSHSDARALIIHQDFLDRWEALRHSLPAVRDVIVDGSDPTGAVPFSRLLEGSPARPPVKVQTSDMEQILYTSGTTGPPKGVVKRHNVIGRRLASGLARGRYTTDDILYTCLPLFHVNAQTLTIMAAVSADASVALGDRFSASGFWDEAAHYKATWTNFIGAMVTILWKQAPAPRDTAHALKYANSVATPAAIWRPFEERFHLKLIEVYALTEGGYLYPDPEAPPGSMGRAAQMMDVRIVDEDDREVHAGGTGELVFRPKLPGVGLVEYYKMPEATREKTKGGWLRTGDLARMDKDGYFYFVDRKKDCIRRRGENISAWEVERVVNMHPDVEESAAYGVPSELGEEDVMVAVVAKRGARLEPDRLIGFLREKMADYMLPRYIEVRYELPKTATLRVEKYRLKKDGVGPGTWDRNSHSPPST